MWQKGHPLVMTNKMSQKLVFSEEIKFVTKISFRDGFQISSQKVKIKHICSTVFCEEICNFVTNILKQRISVQMIFGDEISNFVTKDSEQRYSVGTGYMLFKRFYVTNLRFWHPNSFLTGLHWQVKWQINFVTQNIWWENDSFWWQKICHPKQNLL